MTRLIPPVPAAEPRPARVVHDHGQDAWLPAMGEYYVQFEKWIAAEEAGLRHLAAAYHAWFERHAPWVLR